MTSSKVLIIAGMHRSGTSLITQWLHRCGLFIGDKLEGPNAGNVQGHFEDVDFLEAHQQLLKKRRLSPVGFIDTSSFEITVAEKNHLKDIIGVKDSAHKEWGWKDPRTCLFLKDYNLLLPAAFYLVIMRSYNDTVSSMVTREHTLNMIRFKSKKGLSKLKWKLFKQKKLVRPFERYAEIFLKIWIHYYEQILNHIQHIPKSRYRIINYAQLVENDEPLFVHLKNDWRFSLDYFPFNTIFKKELLSQKRDIEKYITDKNLLEKARTIEMQLASYV